MSCKGQEIHCMQGHPILNLKVGIFRGGQKAKEIWVNDYNLHKLTKTWIRRKILHTLCVSITQ